MEYGIAHELTVAQFLDTLNVNLRGYKVTVAGEVTGRVNRRGAVTYFSLHDPEEEAVLQCMAFNTILDKVGITIAEGMAIKVSGYPEVWKRSGGFSFKVFEVLLTGEGELKRQFEALMKRLEAEGLFSPEHKSPIPAFIKHIGLITAADREAQNDFLTHLSRQGLDIQLYDVRVEGAQAVEQIVEAIEWFNAYAPEMEVLVLTRGGGSLESLQAFNAEAVARAIFASRIPIICGVGHERDVSIADFVADMRASTPTHAAKIISESWDQAPFDLDRIGQGIRTGIAHAVQQYQYQLASYRTDWQGALRYQFDARKQLLSTYMQTLRLADPELKLKQGYSIIRDNQARVIKSVAQIKPGDIVEAQLFNGKTSLKRV